MAGHRALPTGWEQGKDSCYIISIQDCTGDFNQLKNTREGNKRHKYEDGRNNMVIVHKCYGCTPEKLSINFRITKRI